MKKFMGNKKYVANMNFRGNEKFVGIKKYFDKHWLSLHRHGSMNKYAHTSCGRDTVTQFFDL